MLIEKISRGVLAVETEYGVRHIQPSLIERIRLLWTFRNFHVLPEGVLNRHERTLIDSLCQKGKFLSNWNGHGDLSEHCIGTVERTAPRERAQSARLGPAGAQPSPGALPRAS